MKTLISITVLVALASTSVKSTAAAATKAALGTADASSGSQGYGLRIGAVVSGLKNANHNKRDLSLSYAATNIDSKEGTRVKTITVIKNHNNNGNNQQHRNGEFTNSRSNSTATKLLINPELHRSEEWAKAFRDNFDSYGTIPDVPDIDDLFEFVNKKQPKAKEEAAAKDAAPATTTATKPAADDKKGSGDKKAAAAPTEKPAAAKPNGGGEDAAKKPGGGKKAAEKPVAPPPDDDDADEGPVEKIKGDAELLPASKRHTSIRSQSLGFSGNIPQGPQRYRQAASTPKTATTPPSFHYLTQQQQQHDYDQKHHSRQQPQPPKQKQSPPQQQQQQQFEKYVVDISAKTDGGPLPSGYAYPKPCQHAANYPNSISVTTPSGRSYDIPVPTVATLNGRPYIAPSIQKRTQASGGDQTANNNNRTSISVNSLLPPLASGPGSGVAGGNFGGGGSSTAAPSSSTARSLQAGGIAVTSTTSQRPYVAPSLRGNGLGINRGPPPVGGTSTPSPGSPYPDYRNVNQYRPNTFSFGGAGLGGGYFRPGYSRSRGLKY